jgi:hypothetical protein
MNFDSYSNSWFLTMHLKRGKYMYKYIVNGQWIVNDRELKERDAAGNTNNYVIL